MKMSSKHLLVAMTAGAMLLAGCGSGSSGDSGSSASASGSGAASKPANTKPYKILVSGASTGPLSAQGSTAINSAKAGAEFVNANGGIAGRQVEIIVVDDAGDPTTAVGALQKAIATEKPDAYMNSGPSTIAAATLPILTKNEIISFNTGPTADSTDASKYPYNFDLAQDSGTAIKGFVEHIKTKGYKNIAIIHGNSAYGQSFATNAEKQITAAGQKIVANVEYDSKALDMTPQLESAKAANPDAVVLDAYGAPVGYIVKGLEKLGWDVPIMGNTSVTATSLTGIPAPDGILGASGAKNMLIEATPSSVYDPKATAINDAVKAMEKLGPIKTSIILAVNYDGVLLLKAAAAKVGHADDGKELAKALVDKKVQDDAKTVITKIYRFTAEKHAPSAGLDKSDYTFVPPAPVKNGQLQPTS